MRLLSWEGNTVKIAPEIMGIQSFRQIWDEDKDKNKSNAITVFSLIYFMYDPRSSYHLEDDEDTRLAIVKRDIGVPDNWTPDRNYEKACEVFRRSCETTATITVGKNRQLMQKMQKYIDEVTIGDKNIKTVASIVLDLNDLAVKISNTERTIFNDLDRDDSDKEAKLSLGDRGLEKIF
ncbi:MAG: hypothetical protein LBE56_12405 [Tannerella sp.]|jgi:hypothetical protein|nr:hypothetical protein [Tannerella sp.]